MKTALTFLLLIFAFNAQAVELRGDWESAGDMPMPYEPKYDFEYDCQMELKGKAPYVAVTRFTLHNKGRYFETIKGTPWDWVRLGDERRPAKPPKSPDLQLEGHYVSLTLWPAEEGAKDRVSLSLGWKMGWKGAEITGRPYESEFTRADTHLSGRFFLYVYGAKKGDPLKSIEAQVHCHKVK